MEYKRLTVRHPNSDYIAITETKQLKDSEQTKKVLNRLAEIEDKIEQGTMIELPCKVGDTVYFVYDFGSVSGECIDIDEGKVDFISNQKEGMLVHAKYESGLTYWHKQDDIGKTIFFAREEAEKRLKELQNG